MVRRYRSRYHQKPSQLIKHHINNDIRAPQVRVIGEGGENFGVLSTAEALTLAREAESDLIEVSPKAEPPVCRIIPYGKFKYDTEKKLKAQKVHHKKTEIKGIRLSARIQEHDLDIRRKQAQEFLADGNQVKLEIILRGRERLMANQAREVIQKFIQSLGSAQVLSPLTKMGTKVTVLLTKK